MLAGFGADDGSRRQRMCRRLPASICPRRCGWRPRNPAAMLGMDPADTMADFNVYDSIGVMTGTILRGRLITS